MINRPLFDTTRSIAAASAVCAIGGKRVEPAKQPTTRQELAEALRAARDRAIKVTQTNVLAAVLEREPRRVEPDDDADMPAIINAFIVVAERLRSDLKKDNVSVHLTALNDALKPLVAAGMCAQQHRHQQQHQHRHQHQHQPTPNKLFLSSCTEQALKYRSDVASA